MVLIAAELSNVLDEAGDEGSEVWTGSVRADELISLF